MPAPEKHRDQAQRNEGAFGKLDGEKSAWPEWAYTVLFYAAVHEVQAFLVERRETIRTLGLGIPTTHGKRMNVMVKHPPWQKLAQHYDNFRDWSEQARYECWRPGEKELALARVELALIRQEIARL